MSRRYNHNHPEISQRVISAIKELEADYLESTEFKSVWMSANYIYELLTEQGRVVQLSMHTVPLNSKPRIIKLISNHLEENGQPIPWSDFVACLK